MPETSVITIACTCGKRLKAPATAVGRKAKCPSCGNVVTITAPTPPAAAPATRPRPPVPAGERRLPFESLPEDHNDDDADDPSALYGLADKEAAAAALTARDAPPEERGLCPKCMHVMPADAVICMKCGYDTRAAAVPPGAAAIRLEAPEEETDTSGGSLRRGALMCVGFALAASIVWLAVAFSARSDSYFLAILVGVAAGMGMRTGLKDEDLKPGLIAAALALVVSIVARLVIINAVIIPAENRRYRAEFNAKQTDRREREQQLKDQEIAERDPRAVQMLIHQDLLAQGINPEENHDDKAIIAKIEAAEKRAEEKVHSMSREDYEKQVVPKLEEQQIRNTLIERSLDPQLRKMGLNPDFQRIYPEQYTAAEKAILSSVNAMTPQQQRTELKKVSPTALDELAAEKQRLKARYTLAPPRPDELKPSVVGGKDYVLSRLLSFWPILCALLATAAAFRTASGAVVT